MAIALSTLLALAVSVSAEPSSLTLGKSRSARIEIRVKGFGRGAANPKVTLSTNVGTIGGAVRAGDGEFTAEYTPFTGEKTEWRGGFAAGP